jgi:hypothetical protein
MMPNAFVTIRNGLALDIAAKRTPRDSPWPCSISFSVIAG